MSILGRKGLGNMLLLIIYLPLIFLFISLSTWHDEKEKTYEYASNPIRAMDNMNAIQTHMIMVIRGNSLPVPSSSPRRASTLRGGRAMKIYDHRLMQKWYSLAWSKRRKSTGMTRSCNSAEINPELARAYPIWEVCNGMRLSKNTCWISLLRIRAHPFGWESNRKGQIPHQTRLR